MVVRSVREGDGRVFLELLDALCRGPSGLVDILAAADHDGVCSLLVLDHILEQAQVKCKKYPVTGNAGILQHFAGLEADPEVRSVVLLNCGAGLDLQRELEQCRAPAGVKCFLIDSHRPLMLANLAESHDRVVVLDHDVDELVDSRPARPDPDFVFEEEGDSDGEQGEEEWDPDGEENLSPAERAARRAERMLARGERRRRRAEERRAKEEERREQLNDYYRESYNAMPVAISLYRMAVQQERGVPHNLLWLASVSLVAYHELGLISDFEYDLIACNYLKEAYDHADIGGSAGFSQLSQEKPDVAMLSDEEDMTPEKPRMPARLQRGQRSLRFESELRLTLYKHWTLEESVMHSPYFYGAFKLHRDKGVRLLKRFFAQAGISPSQYSQFFCKMQLPIRKTIKKKFQQYGKEVGLTERNMFLDQFVRNNGLLDDVSTSLFLNELSCSDAAHILLAQLSSVPASLSGASLDKLPVNADGHRDLQAIQGLERETMCENFYRATDAVLNKDSACLKEGLALAVEVAKAVQSMARMIVDTKLMRKCSKFRWCKVEQPGHIFRHSLSVRKLSVWLLQVFFSDLSGTKGDIEKPLLMILHDRVRESYLCVGTTPKKGTTEGDCFGSIFRGALRADPSLKFAYDFFDKSCIEIAVDDFDRFVELITSTA